MDMVLIVAEKLILFLVKSVGFECHFEAMCRFRRPLYLGSFALVDSTTKIEVVALSSFLAAKA